MSEQRPQAREFLCGRRRDWVTSLSLPQRPTARELLKHRFLKQARKTSYLVDAIDQYRRWKAAGGEESVSPTANSNKKRKE